MKTPKTVAAILERERKSVIEEWLRRVNRVPALTTILLTDAERTEHLPGLLDDLIGRRLNLGQKQPSICTGAGTHGKMRFAQGYSVPMLVEESRILEVTTFRTLQRHQSELNRSQVLLDVVIVADEPDRQLEDTVVGFMEARAVA
jgi:hypothetical protein